MRSGRRHDGDHVVDQVGCHFAVFVGQGIGQLGAGVGDYFPGWLSFLCAIDVKHDIDAREELLNALNDFEGAVVLVSHDRRLLDATANRLLLVAGGRVEPFDGDLDDYRRILLAGEAAPARRESAKPKPETGGGRIRQLKSRADKAEREVADLSARIRAIDEALAAPGFFQREPAQAADLAKQRASAARDLEQAESAWLAANDEYESALTS